MRKRLKVHWAVPQAAQRGNRARRLVTLFDVFISYAHADEGPVRRLAAAMKNVGLRIWIDRANVADFASITESIQQGFRQSKAFLAFYSSGYPTRRACQWE